MYYDRCMENKINLFRDNQGYVGLIGVNGSDISVLDIKNGLSGSPEDALAEECKSRIAHLIEQDHLETLEHCNLMFRVRAPLFVAREHMSLLGWNCNEEDKYHADINTKFYEPGAYRSKERHGFDQAVINPVLQDKVRLGKFRVYRATKALSIYHESALRLYKHMTQAGICRTQAMAALPQNVYIEYCASASLCDALRFACSVDDAEVLPELRDLARGVLEITEKAFPATTGEWLRSTRKRQSAVAQRLAKLDQLINITEKLNSEQQIKVSKIKKYLESKGEAKNEYSISEREQGAGSTEDPKENRRKARWRFWSKDEGDS